MGSAPVSTVFCIIFTDSPSVTLPLGVLGSNHTTSEVLPFTSATRKTIHSTLISAVFDFFVRPLFPHTCLGVLGLHLNRIGNVTIYVCDPENCRFDNNIIVFDFFKFPFISHT